MANGTRDLNQAVHCMTLRGGGAPQDILEIGRYGSVDVWSFSSMLVQRVVDCIGERIGGSLVSIRVGSICAAGVLC